MAFSAALADRVRHVLARECGIGEKRMFGGVGFLLNGNLLVGVRDHSLIVRLGPEEGAAALRDPYVDPFAPSGRIMRGWVVVGPEGVGEDDRLADWVRRATDFVLTLPAK
jgi:TfoX N-terminal domain